MGSNKTNPLQDFLFVYPLIYTILGKKSGIQQIIQMTGSISIENLMLINLKT